jgi:hypothetical protein
VADLDFRIVVSTVDQATDFFGKLGKSFTDLVANPLEGIKGLASEIGGQLTGALGELGVAGEVAAGALAGVGAAAVGVAATVFGLADHAAHAGEEVLAFSQRTGIAIGNVGALQFATQAAGGTLGDLTGILAKVDMKSVADDGGKFSAALKDIGINAETFKRLDSEQQILALAHGFQEGAKSGHTMADAIDIMGKSGAQNIPLLMKMSDDLVEKGKTLGVQWSEENVHASEQFSVAVNTVETVLGNVATKIGAQVLPAVADMISSFASSPGFISGVTSAVSALSFGLGLAVEATGTLVAGVINLAAPVVAAGAFLGSLAKDAIGGLISGVSALVTWFASLGGTGSGVANTLSAAWTATKTVVVDVLNAILTKLEELPVIGPKIKAAIENASTAFGAMSSSAASVQGATDRVAGALLGEKSASDAAAAAVGAHNRVKGDSVELDAKREKAIQGVIDKLLGESTSVTATKAAVDRVIASGNEDIGVKTRVVETIDRLIKSHVTLTATEHTYFEQNAALSKDTQTSIATTQKMQDEYAISVAKNLDGETQARLLANQKWYDSEVETIRKLTLTDQQRQAELAQLRKTKDQKDKEALDKQYDHEQDYNAESKGLWDGHYAYLAGKAGDDTAVKITAIDDWFTREKEKLDKDKDVTWPDYYNRLAALQATAEDKKDALLRDRAKKDKIAQDDSALDWDTYYLDVAKLQKRDQTDVQIKQVKDSLQKQLDEIDQSKPGWEDRYNALVAIAGVHMAQIAQDYREKTVQPIIDATEGILKGGIEHGWQGIKDAIKSICGEILDYFEHQFVVALINSALGVQNAWGSAFSNIAGYARLLGGGAGGGGFAWQGPLMEGAGAAIGAGAGAGGSGAGAAAGAGGSSAAAGALAGVGVFTGLMGAVYAYTGGPSQYNTGSFSSNFWGLGSPGGVTDPYTAGQNANTYQSLVDQYGADSPQAVQFAALNGTQSGGGFLSPSEIAGVVAAGGLQGGPTTSQPWTGDTSGPWAHTMARGGLVRARYYDTGGPVYPDIVPAWLSEGEGVVTTRGMQRLGASGLDAVNNGQWPGDARPTVHVEIHALNVDGATDRSSLEQALPRIANTLAAAITEEIHYNRGGVGTKMRVAVGLA